MSLLHFVAEMSRHKESKFIHREEKEAHQNKEKNEVVLKRKTTHLKVLAVVVLFCLIIFALVAPVGSSIDVWVLKNKMLYYITRMHGGWNQLSTYLPKIWCFEWHVYVDVNFLSDFLVMLSAVCTVVCRIFTQNLSATILDRSNWNTYKSVVRLNDLANRTICNLFWLSL